MLSHVQLFAALWTLARQAPLSLGILQARILEWVVMPSSRGSSQPRDRSQVTHIAGNFFFFFFTDRATREANVYRVKNNHSASRVHPHPGQDIKPVWKPRSSQGPLLRQSPPFL